MHSINIVREFHQTFGHPVADKPTAATKELRELRVRLIAEELVEYADALGVELTIEPAGTTHEVEVSAFATDMAVNLVEAADALGDLDYVVQGANLIHGFPAEKIVAEIHRSNMSKLGEDGKPIYREDGKVLKGPNYFKPNIGLLLADAGLAVHE